MTRTAAGDPIATGGGVGLEDISSSVSFTDYSTSEVLSPLCIVPRVLYSDHRHYTSAQYTHSLHPGSNQELSNPHSTAFATELFRLDVPCVGNRNITTTQGFEPWRPKGIHLAGEPVNHSGTLSYIRIGKMLDTSSQLRSTACNATTAGHLSTERTNESNMHRPRTRIHCSEGNVGRVLPLFYSLSCSLNWFTEPVHCSMHCPIHWLIQSLTFKSTKSYHSPDGEEMSRPFAQDQV